MGMFDDVWCQAPLPDGYAGQSFQTKDLDCTLSHYRITADGRFEVQRFEMVPDGPPGPHPFFKDWPEHQPMKRVNERWEPHEYHGDLWFYTDEPTTRAWHEYVARFTEGRLVRITQISPPPAESGAVDGEALVPRHTLLELAEHPSCQPPSEATHDGEEKTHG